MLARIMRRHLRSEEREEEDDAEEDEDEGHVGAQTAAEEAESYEGHDDVVVSLAGVVGLAESTWHCGGTCSCSVAGLNADERAEGVAQIAPVRTVDDEDSHGESVAKDELEDTREDHGDTSKEEEGAGERDERTCAGACDAVRFGRFLL